MEFLTRGSFTHKISLLEEYGWLDLDLSKLIIDVSDIHELGTKGLYCLDEKAGLGNIFVIKKGEGEASFQEEVIKITGNTVLPVVSIIVNGEEFAGNPLCMPSGKKNILFKGIQIVDKKNYEEYRERVRLIDDVLSEMSST